MNGPATARNAAQAKKRDSPRPFLYRFFGFDYFIAYRTVDGKRYAEALYQKLTSLATPFRCFIDRTHFPLGGDLPRMQTSALRKSTRLVVIVTPAAHVPVDKGRDWLLSEIREFKQSRGSRVTIVPIGTKQTLDDSFYPGSAVLAEIPHLPMANCILEADEPSLPSEPSDETINRLIIDFDERRQERNRLRLFQGLTAGLSFLLLLAVALGTTTYLQKRLAAHNERRARVSKAAAEGIVDDMLRDLGKKLEGIGKLELLENITRAAENYFVRMDPELRDDDTETHAALTKLTSANIHRQKGEHDVARTEYLTAESQLNSLVKENLQNPRTWRDLSVARLNLGIVARLNNRPSEDKYWLEKAVAAIEQAMNLEPTNYDYCRDSLLIRSQLLITDTALGQPASSTQCDALIDSAMQLAIEDPSAANLRLVSALAEGAALADGQRGELEMAASRLGRATKLILDLEKFLPEDAGVQLDLEDCLMSFAFLEKGRGRLTDAVNALEVANDIARSMRQRDPINQEWIGMQAQLLSVSADLFFNVDQKQRALQMARDASTLLRGLHERHPATRQYAGHAAVALATFGHQLATAGEWNDAADAWQAAGDMFKRLSDTGQLTPNQEFAFATTLRALAEASLAKTPPDVQQARKFLATALIRLRKLEETGKLPKSDTALITDWEKRDRELAGE